MIEVEVHNSLRSFLRSSGEPNWPHHLTMARLVARAIRLGRSALIQTGIAPGSSQGRYRLSYLMPLLMWPEPAILVAPEQVLQRLSQVEIPQLQQWLPISKPIGYWPHHDFQGLILMTPDAWLSQKIGDGVMLKEPVTTVFDGVDDFEEWVEIFLTVRLAAADWNALMLAYPEYTEEIRDARVRLTQAIFQHPVNPYECYLLDGVEQEIVSNLLAFLLSVKGEGCLPPAWLRFYQGNPDWLVWVEVVRHTGTWTLLSRPVELASRLRSVWQQQPVVLIGGALDLDTEAVAYRERLGLGEMTCLKFTAERSNQVIQLYLPDRLPLPNTPQYQGALLRELRMLLSVAGVTGLVVVLVGDIPLKNIVATYLAAEFGSRVQLEKTGPDENGILVSGWEFWKQQQGVLPTPQLLMISTLPIPSLEHPLVAGKVQFYKQQRQDWFRLFLLPIALSELQRAIWPVRHSGGVVALFDSRVIHRSYGAQVLSAISPVARIEYFDETLLSQ